MIYLDNKWHYFNHLEKIGQIKHLLICDGIDDAQNVCMNKSTTVTFCLSHNIFCGWYVLPGTLALHPVDPLLLDIHVYMNDVNPFDTFHVRPTGCESLPMYDPCWSNMVYPRYHVCCLYCNESLI